MNIQQMVQKLTEYWVKAGCIDWLPYDVEKGAVTGNPHIFFNSLGVKNWNVALMESSRRPQDARYGKNPNRVYQHHQFEVLMKPAPSNIQELYIGSLEYLGLNFKEHDLKFIEDNWEQPTLGAWGLGWEVRLDGMEVTQFTYFQQIGSVELKVIPVELAYGVERLAMYIQNKNNVYDLEWVDGVTYGQIFKKREYEFSKYGFEVSEPSNYFKLFDIFKAEADNALKQKLPLPAYDFILKCSHSFNILDATKSISAKERTRYILEIRDLAKRCAETYLQLEN